MMKTSSKLAALSVAFASAVGIGYAEDVVGNVNAKALLDNSYLLYNLNAGSGVIISVNSLGSFGATLTDFTVPADPTFPVAKDFPYLFLATTTSRAGAPHVVVSLKDAGAADGVPFETVFAGASEGSLINSLQSGSTDDLVGFYNTYMSLFPSFGQSTLEKFSDGTNAGTVFATPVPEPCSMAVLGLGVVALIRRRRS